MRVTLVRKSFAQQIGAGLDLTTFKFFSVFTTGWTQGSRNRTRHFSTSQQVFAYLNKLHAGGWLSDIDYAHAWDFTLVCAEDLFCEIDRRVNYSQSRVLGE